MRHLFLIGVKVAMIWTILAALFALFGPRNQPVFMASLIVALAAYPLGDLYVLRYFGNVTASVVDWLLAAGTLWLATLFISEAQGESVAGHALPFGSALVAGAVIALGEVLFHVLVIRTLDYPQRV